ncbi:MAG: type II secretion system protein GspD [Planctomycetota bacterium]|jgi:general secretion pathway protein D
MRWALATLLLASAAFAQAKPFRGEDHAIERFELRGARVVDGVRLIAELSGLNVVSTEEAGKRPVTMFLQGVAAGRAVETLCKVAGLWYRRDEETQTFRVMTTEEFQRDHVVYRKGAIRVFTLQHPNSIVIGSAIEDLFGDRVTLSLGVEEEEAIDLPAGFDLASGSGGVHRLARDNVGGRSLSHRDDYLRRANTGRRGGRMDVAERVVEELLTPDQLEKLPAGEATTEQLRGISRRDPPIYVTVNRQHNLVVVRTSDSDAMREIEVLIAELDRPTPQVLLEMKILALDIGDGFRSIFDIEYTGGTQTSGPQTSTPANPLLLGAETAPRNVAGSGNFDLEDSTFVYQFLNNNFRARLQLLETENRIDILATPIVLASNNRPARMFVGEERVLTTGVDTNVITSGVGPVTQMVTPITETRDVGNTLVVVPKINADRTVTLFLLQDNSTVLEQSATIPVPSGDGGVEAFPIDTVETANLQATVVAKDGMTLAVGGLIRVELLDAEEKVPVLGDIPVLKFFFRKKVKQRDKRELVLLIKPRVLFTPAEADAATRERVKALSDHPYVNEGEKAFETDVKEILEKKGGKK